MIGSKEYDPKNNDWACNEDYVPINKYLQLNINKSIKNYQYNFF